MYDRIRTLSRRTLTAIFAALLLGTATAPVAAREVHAVQSVHQHIWYYTAYRGGTLVGEALVYCDGQYQLLWGVATSYALYATNDCAVGEPR